MATVTFRIMPIVDFDSEIDFVVSDDPQPSIETPTPHLTRCIVAFFQNGTEVAEMRKTYTSDSGYESTGLTASIQMANGQTYSIVVYMDNNKDYVNVTDLKAITLDRNGYILDGDPQIFSSDKFDITVTEDTSKDVSVLRRYCRISFIDTNPTSKIGDKVYHVYGFTPSTFNAYTGRLIDSFTSVYFTNTSVAMLATSNQSISFSLMSYSSEGELVKDQNVSNVSVNRNYWTKVYWSSAARKSVDLTTLSGWGNLAPGNHTIKIVAKGTGYRDSEKSGGVEVTKAAEVYTDCLTFTGESSEFTLKPQYKKVWDGTLYYSTDHNTWNVWNGEEISSANKKLYLKGKGNTKFEIYDDNAEDFYYAEFKLSAKAGCSGNIQTLLDWENPPTSIPANDCFNKMFFGCTNLTIAPELPAKTLAQSCYSGMFANCTNLTTAPDLPATTLSGSCYSQMFSGCTSLTSAPELPAKTLAQYCYSGMFDGCTNLITATALPATTLANCCYCYMFQGCAKLKVSASSGNKIFTCPSTIPSMAVTNMFTDTGGSFKGTPTAGNTYYWTE